MNSNSTQSRLHSSVKINLKGHRSKPQKKGAYPTNILVAVDFSSESRKAVGYALSFAQRFAAAITLLHVVEPEACPADYGYGPVTVQICCKDKLKKAKKRLDSWNRELIGEKLGQTLVLSGSAYVEIIGTAKKMGTNLIIMGTHGDVNVDGMAMGSTAERVVRHAHCPVFVVRKNELEFAI